MDFFSISYPWELLLLVLVAATLYSTVGHGGASGYLAAMALFGLTPDVMKPAALTMNIFVTSLVLFRLARAGHFNLKLFIPFAVSSIPFAFIGGAYTLQAPVYRIIVGVALLVAAIHFLRKSEDHPAVAIPSPWSALPVGAGLGLISGLTGVGGGIFLSPLLLLLRWTNMRSTAAIAAAFILVNSIAGLAGYATTTEAWPAGLPVLVATAVLGALIGSELGARQLAPGWIRKLLGVVLLIAGARMIHAAVI